MKKQILLPQAKLRELREKFEVGRNDLRRALNYERNSDRAKMLRAAVLRHGGVVYTGYAPAEGYCPADMETTYDQVRNVMYQKLGKRVGLEICLTTDSAVLTIDNESVATFDKVTLETWRGVLFAMQQLHEKLISKS